MGRIGFPEILVLSIILLIPFFIGYLIGKKSGYLKRIKEEK
jgi:hypothetical protein